MARALEIILTEAERVELERRARRRKIAHGCDARADCFAGGVWIRQ